MRSETAADNSGKLVLDVVSSTMKDIVFSSNKDTFILFYKPDCQHCRDFMQTWLELGGALQVFTEYTIWLDVHPSDLSSIKWRPGGRWSVQIT